MAGILKTLTLGCKVNQYETQLVREGLLGIGFRDANADESANQIGAWYFDQGRYEEAESQLASASPRPDGAELYYRALANLCIPGEDAATRARELFEQLLERYPDSPLTLYVGSFVAQLRL